MSMNSLPAIGQNRGATVDRALRATRHGSGGALSIPASGIALAVLLSAFAPGSAQANYVLDSGTPTGSGAPVVLSTSQWLAGEFAVTAGQDITSLAAYLTQGVGQPGDTFTFDIYSGTNFTSTRESLLAPVFSTTGTFSANGWNSAAVNWTPTASGDYWLALQVGSTLNTRGLDAPVEASAATGTAPALGFAYFGTGTNGKYTSAGAPDIGLEVMAAPVPLPPSLLLLASGLGLGAGARAVARRRRR